ncbi:hypothetical protein QQS21_000505 [Conoideocrella luteorostrata]|uniref:Peptidase S8/S53 domain-containing protein n=1 Tax=Conoideocrella luteorostrata TaxID=1105319 RepID=A0AAJ0G3X7_9HYPO|nr:hypothetical protein QQS21_000505 [Conoideocrella luteorostrata]
MSLNGILEWQAIVALRSYLIFTLPGDNRRSDPYPLEAADISGDNAEESFEFELTRVFVRQDPPLQVGDAWVNDCHPKLVKLVTLLDSLVRSVQRYHSGRCSQLSTKYTRLGDLLEHLEATKVPLNLINGPLGPAFDMPKRDMVERHLKTVQDVNFLLDSLLLSQKRTEEFESLVPAVATPEPLDDSVREYATAAFNAIFGQLKRCNPEHSVMLYLRSQQDDSLGTPKASLDLFFSSCVDRHVWQEIQCGERENLELGPREVKDLCRFINGAKKQGRIIHVAGEEIQNITQTPPHARHPRDAPSKSLRSLILGDAFKPLDVDHVVSVRFSRVEKRKLAVDIASSLSRLLGSQWVGEGWCSKDLFFLGNKVDQSRSNTPFGPYITCSAAGPPSDNLERWRPNLGDPPILLFLAKLLLEIDLGKDLDDSIDEALKKDPNEDIWFLLSEIKGKYNPDLEYSDAIEYCLNYHMKRQAKLELGEISGTASQWSEWDRTYIRGVIKKLAKPATEAPEADPEPKSSKKRQKGRWWMGHIINPASEAYSPPASLFEVPPTTMSYYSCDSVLADSLEPATSLGPSRSGSTYPTTVNFERRTQSPSKDLAAAACHPIPAKGYEAKPNAELQMLQPSRNISPIIGGWLDGADQSVASAEDPLKSPTSALGMTEGDKIGVLFDATEFHVLHDHLKDGHKQAEEYWELMRDFNKKHFLPSPDTMLTDEIDMTGTNEQTVKNRGVKLALIDTGLDINDSLIKIEMERGRIKCRSWVKEDISDSCGHGTHLVRLVLQVSKSTDILMAKVSDRESFSPRITQNIVEAIQWAVKEDADIISLSLGFKNEVKPINDAIDEALRPRVKTGDARPRLIFAAAANWGFNRPLAFPACKKGVICVYATFGNGYDGRLGPKQDDSVKNFPIGTLGVTIESRWKGKAVWLKGTSYATPIASAVAANVLEFARRNLDAQVQSELERFRGMKAVLALMCKDCDSKSYRYCAPWVLYEKIVNNEKISTTEQILKAIRHEIEELDYL